jgi:integrase/recombinase XerD
MRGIRRREEVRLPDPGNDPEGLAAHVCDYLEAMRIKNFSEGTVEARIIQLNQFLAWCQERGLTRSCEVTRPILERYQRWLYHYRKRDGRPLGIKTQQHRLVTLRAFFKHLVRQNLLLSNPAADLELPRSEQRLPGDGLSVEEVEQILAQTDVTKPLGLRDRAIIETLYSTGIRRMELCGLRLWNVDVGRGTLTIRQGKGKKDRVVPIGERALAWIEKYRVDVRPDFVAGADSGALFLNELGEALAPSWLTIMVRRYVARAGVQKRGACHLFRHATATLMLEGGADVRFIQEMLGHAKLDTTQIYTHVSIQKLKAIHTATHPGARLESNAVSPANDASDEADRAMLHSALAAEGEEE